MPNPETIFAVVVLYRCRPDVSTTIRTLRQTLPPFSDRMRVLVYDNSPERWEGQFPEGWEYKHDPANGGILAAYNNALQEARGFSCWLLLLDQDSSLPEEFLQHTFLAIDRCQNNQMVGAIVPRIYSEDGLLISPSRVRLGRCTRENRLGLLPHESTALNSGSLIRVVVLNRLDGFSKDFWLDCLDYWLYSMIFKLGYRVFVSNATLTHSLSVIDYNRAVSFERYKNILLAEMKFTNTCRPWLEQVLYLFRLMARAIKHMTVVSDKRIAKKTAEGFFRQANALISRRRGVSRSNS